MTKIKICGIRTSQDVEYINALLPDYAGFVFYDKSHRYVTPETAANLRSLMDRRIVSVGVFVDHSAEFIVELVKNGTIDIVQLHGNEDDAFIETIRKMIDVPIMKAFGISNRNDFEKAILSAADIILLDNGTGGTGEQFNRIFIDKDCRPFFFAGGLDSDNVSEVVRSFHPYAVDISSGVETDGSKDSQKMKQFIDAVRFNTEDE